MGPVIRGNMSKETGPIPVFEERAKYSVDLTVCYKLGIYFGQTLQVR